MSTNVHPMPDLDDLVAEPTRPGHVSLKFVPVMRGTLKEARSDLRKAEKELKLYTLPLVARLALSDDDTYLDRGLTALLDAIEALDNTAESLRLDRQEHHYESVRAIVAEHRGVAS